MNDTENSLRATIAAWLRDQGHQATVEPSDERYAHVTFRARGLNLYVHTDETDPLFLFIALVTDLPDDVTDELPALRAAAAIESQLKVVKVAVDWEARTTTIATEQFVSTPGGPDVFWRSVGSLANAFHLFDQAVREQIGLSAATEFTQQLEAELASGNGEGTR
jgi:hypothetical protein